MSRGEWHELWHMSRNFRRVKEQFKKIGGMEFYDVNFSYIDNDSFDEHFVTVPEIVIFTKLAFAVDKMLI